VGLGKWLEVNKRIQSIEISGYTHKNLAKTLSNTLKGNTTLTRLHLRRTRIGNEGIEVLREVLKSNNTLQYLDFSANLIGDKGIHELSEAMKLNTSVTELHLSWNPIGNAGGKELLYMLVQNHSLVHLGLDQTQVSDEILREIADFCIERDPIQLLKRSISLKASLAIESKKSEEQEKEIKVMGITILELKQILSDQACCLFVL